ncbi:hypothetical protein ACFL7M_18815, partial [Thermodesulfobacteriota bacterium]
KDSPLGKVFPKGMKGLTVSDFKYYPASNQQISFILAPIKGATEEEAKDEVVGVLALKLDNHAINTIVHRREGWAKRARPTWSDKWTVRQPSEPTLPQTTMKRL